MVETTLKMVSYIIILVQNGPKWLETVQNYRQGGKKFQNFSINSKKFKNYISFEIFTHLSSELPTRIPGASFGKIWHHLFQVTSHVLLFHFHANFFNFHGQIWFFGQSKLVISAHMDIEDFSVYRAGYMRKNHPKLRTYMNVLQTVTYAAAHKVF